MLRCKIRKIHSASDAMNGRHLLLVPGDSPAYWPNLYATLQLYGTGHSDSSVLSNLAAIGVATDWMLASTGEDLSERILKGSALDSFEASRLGYFFRLTNRQQDRELAIEIASKDESAAKGRLRRLESLRSGRRAFPESVVDTVGDETAANSIRFACNYIDWLYSLRSHPVHSNGFDDRQRDLAMEGLSLLRGQVPRVAGRSIDDESLWSIPQETVDLIESLVRPDSDRNPWRSDFLRDRNYLLWRLFYETGGRRGEILNIRMEDFTLPDNQVTFRVTKTVQRTVPFSARTGALVDDFIADHWGRLPRRARNAGYLFTSDRGCRLSERSVNNVFESIRGMDPRIPDWFTPHTMRRTWNDRFSRMLDALPENERWTGETESRVRGRLMGWTAGSRMPQVYLKRHTRESTDAAVARLFEDSEPVFKEGKGGGHD